MNIVGIVAEYNPFHAGHRWHIAQTRRRLGECAVVAVMSGNFVQRGDCAIEDKWARTRSALEGGADLVLELPTVWACASAEWFAWGAMSILRAAGAQAISFGSESGDNAALAALSLCLDSGRFQAELRRFLEQGLPFAACRQAAADALLGQDVAACLTRPNDNLAVEYLKAARRLNWTPQILAIPRVGAGHDGGAHPEFPSASFLREEILAGRLEAGNPAALKYNERGILTRLRAMDLPDFGGCIRPPGGPLPWRKCMTEPRPSVTPTPASGVWCCGPPWACGKLTAPRRLPISGCWGPMTGAGRRSKP